MEIQNKASIENIDMEKMESNVVTIVIKDNPNNNDEDPEEPDNPNNPENLKNSISGVAWLDKNQDSRRGNDEELISGMQVELLDEQGNNVKTTTTNQKGAYAFSDLENNNYLVAFKYDTNKYSLTEYRRNGVNTNTNSDAFESEITNKDGNNVTVGLTDIINIEDNNASNIDIGLIENNKFDLRLDKYISEVTVKDNNGNTIRKYNNGTLAKIELNSATINKTTVNITYKISVTNEGDVAGYATKIVDYMPDGLEFNVALNSDWNIQGNQLINDSLNAVELEPGETRSVNLTLTKKMTENNTGTIINTAEILESYNEKGIDSIAGNKQSNEDDISTVSLILSIKTGEIYLYIGLFIVTILILGIGCYYIKKEVLSSKEN